MHLLRTDSAAKHRGAHVAKAWLFLRMNSDVIAVHVVRRLLGLGGVELKSDSALQFFLEVGNRPSVAQKEKFQPRPLAVLAQLIGVSKQFGNAATYRCKFIQQNER